MDSNGSSGPGVWAGQRERPGLSTPPESAPTAFKLVTDQTENVTIRKGITIMEDREVVTEQDGGSPMSNRKNVPWPNKQTNQPTRKKWYGLLGQQHCDKFRTF